MSEVIGLVMAAEEWRPVRLAMVHGGSLEWGTVESLIGTLHGDASDRHWLEFSQEQSIYVPASRQKLATKFLADGYPSWLFFIDADILWELRDVYEILDSADAEKAPVVSALVFLNGPHGIHPAGWQEGEEPIRDWDEGGMVEAFVVGTGFTCYHRSVLQAVQDRHGTMFAEAWEEQRFFGEDVAFSYRARECGFPLHINCDVRPGHLKRVVLDEGWAHASREMRAAARQEET